MKTFNKYFNRLMVVLALTGNGCTKFVQIRPPANTITTSEVFSDSSDATSAVLGIYRMLSYRSEGGTSFGNGLTTDLFGLSADELIPFTSGASDATQFYTNALTSSNSTNFGYWSEGYNNIYQANACIAGLQAATGISPATISELTGEAKFLRALCYFYLVTAYGNVPYVSSIAYAQTENTPNTPAQQVYANIVSDLSDAAATLPMDYSLSNGEKIRASSWAATALLARTYLYLKKWDSAAVLASMVINNSGLFSLDTLNGVFLANSDEAILQWQTNGSNYPYNATNEGYTFIPYDNTSQPNQYYLSNLLLNAFEAGDQRFVDWVDSTNYNGQIYYYPYKYKIGASQIVPGGTPTEYYMVLRLGEQYLIRAEARAQLGNILGPSGALADLDTIRNRAGLADYAGPTDQATVLAAILHERQVELFAEWGHRWLDLIRTGTVNTVLGSPGNECQMKGGSWNANWQVYPIPRTDLTDDPNLKQNPGY